MAVDERRLQPLSFGLGIANKVDETAVPTANRREGTAGAARAAVNLDILVGDRLKSRDGYRLGLADPGAHSFYAPPGGNFALYVAGGELKRLDLSLSATAIATGLSGRRVAYATVAGRIRWSDGTVAGEVTSQGDARPWGIDTPPPSFDAAPANSGGMHAGRYMVTLTFITATGEESGAPDPVFVTVPSNGGIQLTDIPTPAQAFVAGIRVYVSRANSEDLFQVQTLAPGTSAVLIGASPEGIRLNSWGLYPMPAGDFLLARQGRLLTARGTRYTWSHPLRYALHKPSESSQSVPGVITMLAAPDGVGFLVYVGTTKAVHVLSGESVDTHSQSVAWSRGAVKDSMTMVPADALGLESPGSVPCWIDTDGQFVAGTSSGVIVLNKLAVADTMRRCSATFLDLPGIRKLIVSGRRTKGSRMAMGDRAIATITPVGLVGQ